MGIYIFNTQLLIPILLADAEDPKSHHDFGKDILPRIITKYRVFAYNFVDENSNGPQYWRDVGTIDAYYEANMDLVACRRFSTCTTRPGRCAPGSTSIRRQNRFCRSRPHGRGARFHCRRRLDHFGRPRE